jgi:hypothetical protein
MADGDRFERALRGPWRFPFRIAAGGAAAERVAEKRAGSCLSLMDDEIVLCVRKMTTALDAALAQNSMPLFLGEPQNAAFQRLARSLDLIAEEHHFDELAQSCGRAASRCFLGLEHVPHISDEHLEQRFARELIVEIVGRHFFPIVRERLAENAGRDAATQGVWEDHIMQCMTDHEQSLLRALFGGHTHRGAQRHIRSVSAPRFDWNRLNEPLHVLGV